MSSRNVRLSADIRQKAGAIYALLQNAITLLPILSSEEIQQIAIASLNTIANFKVDYFLILNAKNLQPITRQEKVSTIVIITAVIVDGVRLLDNVVME